MNEDTAIARILFYTFAVLVTTVGGCEVFSTYSKNAAVVDMVKAGARPVEAACSVGRGTTEQCTAVILSKP